MHNLNTNDLDAIFREGADNHEYSYNDESWQKMSAMLDEQDRKRRVFWIILSLLLISLIGVATWTLLPEHSQASKNEPLADSATISKKSGNLDNPHKETNSTLPIDKSDNENNLERNNTTTSDNIYGENKSIQNIAIGKQVSSQEAKKSQRTKNNITNTFSKRPIANVTPNNTTRETNEASKDFATQANPVVATSGISDINIRPLPISELQLFSASTFRPMSPTTVNPNFSLKSSHTSGLFFSLFASSEWSSVGVMGRAKRGWSVGANIGVALSSKWELNSGVAISKKKFQSNGNSYTMEGGWLESIEPMEMSSKCTVTEIPVHLTYYLNGRIDNGFFFRGGISSYMMSKEWYGFEYQTSDIEFLKSKSMEPVDEVTVSSEQNHYIGVGDFSFGYQHKLSNGTHLQISPYLQFPLTGIGSGELDLWTRGVKLAVRFSK